VIRVWERVRKRRGERKWGRSGSVWPTQSLTGGVRPQLGGLGQANGPRPT
jgi:hypothetical protein